MQKLDWKSLLNQKPAPSSITKRSYLLPESPAPVTPGTPVGSNSSTAAVHDQQSNLTAAIPFLLLPVAIPTAKDIKIPTGTSADELLSKLAQLKKTAASLVEAAALQKPCAAANLLEGPQILPDPLLPPEHVYEADTVLWYNSEEMDHSSISSQAYAVESSNNEGARAAARPSTQVPHSSTISQETLAGYPSQRVAISNGDSMATSLTHQVADSSLLTTANSPSLRVQQALGRIRQLQHHTEEAFHQGALFGEPREEESM